MLIAFIFFGLFVATLLLFSHVYVIFVISEIYQKRDKIITKELYIILLKYIGIFIFIFTFCYFISNFLYSIMYIICFTYIGYFIYVFLFCFLYKLITKFKNLTPIYAKIFVLIIPLIITIFSLINAQITEFEEVTLIYPGYKSSIKIMHISDMHLGAIYQKGSVENLVKIINEKNPDVVVITGDLSDGSLKFETEWLEPFNEIKENINVLYVTGNHENLYGKDEIIKEITKIKKIKYIGDIEEIINIKDVAFIGIDYEYKDIKTKAKSIIDKYDVLNQKIPIVLLYHVPNVSLKVLNEIGIFLMISGHTHGGQVFPFHILVLLTNKYFCGLYNYNNSNYVFVSTGYGTALVPMRFFSNKMIGIINIKGE